MVRAHIRRRGRADLIGSSQSRSVGYLSAQATGIEHMVSTPVPSSPLLQPGFEGSSANVQPTVAIYLGAPDENVPFGAVPRRPGGIPAVRPRLGPGAGRRPGRPDLLLQRDPEG